MTDVGIRHGLIGYRDSDISGLLENIVYLDLRARGYSVSIGKYREYRALEQVRDNHPKLVLSLDPVKLVDRSGIPWRNIVDFLLAENIALSP